tara:strand:+ start:389 stop:1285 length:897 start_codon:yes stop_codon:yes gene_type:complete
MRKGASVPFFILVIFAQLIQFNMTTQTKKSPGRPRKAQTATPVAPAAPAKKKRGIKRKEQINQNKEYEILKGGGVAFMLPQKGVTVYDEENDTVREIRYCPNEQSIFRDEQSENARRESVVFRNKKLFIPKDKPNLRKFIEMHPLNKANGGNVFAEVNKKLEAESQLKREFLLTDAIALVRDTDIQELLPVALYFQVNINQPVAEIRFNLLRIAKNKPQEFIESFDSPQVQARSVVIQAKDYQIIRVAQDAVYWFDSNGLIVSVPVGQDAVDVMVRFCLTEKGASVLSSLEERLERLA